MRLSVYNKLNGMESSVSAELVRETGASMEAIIRHLKGNLPDWLTGYRVKILDGNALGASEHRLKPLRDSSSAPLPGKSLVVLDPSLMLAIDVFPCEDGHAQERSLLPQVLATALVVAQIYRNRWNIETLFQILTDIFNCEIKTLAYPKAALFAFCVALVSYNILSVVLAALRSVHGIEKIEQEVSSYYLADEIRGTYRGMMIAIPQQEWQVFNQMNLIDLTKILKNLATLVNLAVFLSHPRSTKKTKKWVMKNRPTKKPHVSTAKILSQNKTQK